MDIKELSDIEHARFRQLVAESENMVICCHKSPDGDALGSSLAMAEYLRHKGKKPVVIVPDASNA